MEIMESIAGLKHDTGKTDWALLPWEEVEELVRVYMHGVEEYGRDNWRKGFEFHRLFNAAERHLMAFWRDGQDFDPDTGLPHLVQAAWNLITLWHTRKNHPEMDDRPGIGQAA